MAVMANTFAMTALLIALGVSGNSSLAADIGIVHGASLALFFAFSANARSLILSKSSPVSAKSIMLARLILLMPLSVVSYFLSVGAGVESHLAIVLILRRAVEWLGEVQLSEMERLGRNKEAEFYLVVQSLLLAVGFGWLMFNMPDPYLGLWLWAIFPLLLNLSAIVNAFSAVSKSLGGLYISLFPHLGSSAVIGITIYTFRLLLLYTAGKETAGDLFAAFAIGGLTGSIFANALGASITFHEQQSGKRHSPWFLRTALNSSLMGGVVIFIAAVVRWPVLEMAGKSYLFWQAVGLSLIGGVVMVYAQRIRFRLLQNDEEHDVFGPDVMMNILLLATVPFAYYLLGRESMAGLYLLSAVLAYIFYISYLQGEVTRQLSEYMRRRIKLVIAIALLFPLFFQASHGIFHDPSYEFNSDGKLLNLPVPLSVFACYAGIVLLGGYRCAYFSFLTIFLTCILMLLSTIFSTMGDPVRQEAKLVLLVQFVLPMFALVLGQMYQSNSKMNVGIGVGKMFLWVLVVIVPLQLVSSWYQGSPYLVPSVGGVFSIYQLTKYVPVIFVSGYLVALFALWHLPTYRRAVLVLAPFMTFYVAASLSVLAIGLILFGFFVLAVYYWRSKKEKMPVVVFMLAVILSWSYLQWANYSDVADEELSFVDTIALQSPTQEKPSQEENQIAENMQAVGSEKPGRVVSSIQQRVLYWSYFLNGVMSSPETFMFGHDSRPDRNKYPSARNYYLDFIYNYGLLALFPILALLTYTCALIYRLQRQIYLLPWLTGLSVVVLILLFVDNSLGVGLRQPYPGIFTFFLWGLLLNHLLSLNAERKSS